MTVPYAFGAATSAIPLSQLDSNFNTPITLGNTAIQLGNTVTTLNNMTLANVTISSGNVTITNVSVTTVNASTVNTTTLVATTANVTTINATDVNVAANVTLNAGTVNGVAYLNGSKVLTTGSALTFDGTNLYLTGNQYLSNNKSLFINNASGVAQQVLTLGNDNNIYFGQLTSPTTAALYTYGSQHIYIVGASEGMRLTSTGLGIGTSSPSTKLTVANGQITVTNSGAINPSINFAGSGSGASGFQIGQNYNSQTLFVYDNAAASQRLTLDSSGNLGLGVTPSAWESTAKAFQFGSLGYVARGSSGQTMLGYNNYLNTSNQYIYIAASQASRYEQISGEHRWFNAASGNAGDPITFTQAMTLDASGNLRIGLTSSAYNTERITVYKSGNVESAAFINDAGANNYTVAVSNRATTGDNKFMVFATESSDTTRGTIAYNRGTGFVVYSTTSDYRAKDIIGPVENPGAVIDAVPVYMGKMKGATQERPMFIAHETPAYAHTGEKDAVDKEGNPIFQQMDASSLVPILWAELQSLRARVAQLESKGA